MSDDLYGWIGKILQIDLTKSKIGKIDLPKNLCTDFIGCRGINSKILYDQVNPKTHPLDPENVLIWGTGPLEGTPIGMGRYSVTTKNLRGSISEGGLGGFFAPELKFAGYDHIVIRGKSKKPVFIWIDDEEIEIRDAKNIWGKNTWETDSIIKEELGDDDIQICYIGPAAENMVHSTPLISGLTHAGCRAGFGEVMGSKKLKAIAVRGTGGVKVAQIEKFMDLTMKLFEYFEPANVMDPWYLTYLTGAPHILIGNEVGNIPTRNAQQMSFEFGKDISGEKFFEKYYTRRRACFGCPLVCMSSWYKVPCGPYAGTEGGGAWNFVGLGSMVGINYLPAILKAITLCNQLGLDWFHVGYSIAWAMECFEKGLISRKDTDGLVLKFGNHESFIEMIKKIAYREGFGDVLADGVDAAAKKIGKGSEKFALTVKGQECEVMPQRNLYVAALGIATSETGPDHTRWYPPYAINPATVPPEKLKELNLDIDFEKAFQTRLPEGKGRLLKWLTDSRAVLESIPTCLLIWRGIYHVDLNFWADLLTSGTGLGFKYKQLIEAGERIMNIERAFNVREGFRRKDDTIPFRMQTEHVSAHHYGPLISKDFNYMLDEYYKDRGWDLESGIPTQRKLEQLSLEYIVKDLEGMNIMVK